MPIPRIPPKTEKALLERARSNARSLSVQFERAIKNAEDGQVAALERELKNVNAIIETYPARVHKMMRKIVYNRKET